MLFNTLVAFLVFGVSSYVSPKNCLCAFMCLLIAHQAVIYRAIMCSASKFHEKWRDGWRKQNGGDQPRWKEGDTPGVFDVNINQDFIKLPYKWQFENLEASKSALVAVYLFFWDREMASAFIHDEWLKRHSSSNIPVHQKVPYSLLSEEEKQKDRDHYDIVLKELISSTVLFYMFFFGSSLVVSFI